MLLTTSTSVILIERTTLALDAPGQSMESMRDNVFNEATLLNIAHLMNKRVGYKDSFYFQNAMS